MLYSSLPHIKWKALILISVLIFLASGFFPKTEIVSNSSFMPIFENSENSIIFVGHSTVLIHLGGVNILTDPNFNNGLIFFPRKREAGLKIKNLPKIDAILISHAHRDHLDEWSLKQFPKETPILISKGNGDILRDWGFTDVRETDIWNEIAIEGVKIIAAPAKHSGARNSATSDYPKALGYIVEGKKIVYFAGDTGLSDIFKEIGNKYKIDVALLPAGAYSPRWFMKSHHMSPEDALKAMKMLGSKRMIPIHWGSFRMAFDGVDEPKKVLLELAKEGNLKNEINILENGEKFIIE